MTSIVDRVATAARKWVSYQRTLAELSSLPSTTKQDLDISSRNVREIASRAVYGR